MTDLTILMPYLVFCVLMTSTPGPNNAMVLAAGAQAGFWRSMPLVCGIAVGVGLQLVAIGFGLGAVFAAYPPLHTALRVVGSLYLIWLAFKIARGGVIRTENTADRPSVGFNGAVLFQWVNPKAWAITTSAAATYVPTANYTSNIAVAAAVLAFIAIPCVSVWVAGGSVLRRYLLQPRYARAFNLLVALLLAATTVPILMSH